MGFSCALVLCQKMVESCVRFAGFSADALLMDRNRAPAMTQDSICFRVYVDGVCAVLQPFEGSSCIGGCGGGLGRCWLAVL